MKKNLSLNNLITITVVSVSAFVGIIMPQTGNAQFIPAEKVLVSNMQSVRSMRPTVSSTVIATQPKTVKDVLVAVDKKPEIQEPVVYRAPEEIVEISGTLTPGATLPVLDTTWITQTTSSTGTTTSGTTGAAPTVVIYQQPVVYQGGFVPSTPMTTAPVQAPAPVTATTYHDAPRGAVITEAPKKASPKVIKKTGTPVTQTEDVQELSDSNDYQNDEGSRYGASVSGLGMNIGLVGLLVIVLVFLLILNAFKKLETDRKKAIQASMAHAHA